MMEEPSNLCGDILEGDSHPSRYIHSAHRNQPTYNAIHIAIMRWDQSCLNRLADGFTNHRRQAALTCLRNFGHALLAQSDRDQDQDNYGRSDFVQTFWGYLLYRIPISLLSPIEVVSLGVNPDCRRQLAATRLLYRLTNLAPKRKYVIYIPFECLELCVLLKKHTVACERFENPDPVWRFSWEGVFPLLKAPVNSCK